MSYVDRLIFGVKRCIEIIQKDNDRFCFLAGKGFYNDLNDKEYLSRMFRAKLGKDINWDNPQTYNEKMQYLKLYDRNPLYHCMVDKYDVKTIVSNKIGHEHVVETYGIWNSPTEINYDILPQKFVLKCTHDSGSVFICRDKNQLEQNIINKVFLKKLNRSQYLPGREWVYKDVKPRIMAERLLETSDASQLVVYKVFNFSGNPFMLQVIHNDKQPNETVDYFDLNLSRLNIKQIFPNSNIVYEKDETFEEMIQFAHILSDGIPFVRTDFYVFENQVYFSEFTFYSDAGFGRFEPEEWDEVLGKKIDLSSCYYGKSEWGMF